MPTVATSTHLVVQSDNCDWLYGRPLATELTLKTTFPCPEEFVTPIGWAASCNPQPALLASFAFAHSERKNFPPTPNPDTVTSTLCPFTKLVDGVITTLGLCVVRAGTKVVDESPVGGVEAPGSAVFELPQAASKALKSEMGTISLR